MMLVDVYSGRKQYDSALLSIDRVGEAVGDDPHLDFLRGSVHYLKRDLSAAKAAFERANSREPSLPGPYLGLLTLSLEAKDSTQTTALLTALERHTTVVVPDLTKDPVYPTSRSRRGCKATSSSSARSRPRAGSPRSGS